MEKINAYWFAASDTLPHSDGRKIIIGEHHSVNGPLVICRRGLHASRHPFDALQYAPGPYLYKVLCWDDIQEQSDKLVSRNREYVDMRDATAMLRAFARECALSVVHLWDAPDIVLQYLRIGDDNLRAAAEAVWVWAGSAAEAAAAAAAAAAAWEAARDVAMWVWAAREHQMTRFSALVADLFEAVA